MSENYTSHVTHTTSIRESDFDRLKASTAWRRLSQAEFLENYVALTDNLITAILEFDRNERGEAVPADYVIYLDKSARPLAWMTRQLWPHLARTDNEEGAVLPQPQMRFLNIDRKPWRIDPDQEITTYPDNMRQPSSEDIQGLRSIFTRPGEKPEDVSPLDNQRILVVDEISDSGDTLAVATKLLHKAFPTAVIRSYSWMNDFELAPDGSKRVMDRPVWYQESEESGRGVFGQVARGNIRANRKSTLTTEAHQFLSTRPMLLNTSRGPNQPPTIQYDARGRQLRADIVKMAAMFAEGKLMPAPSVRHEDYYNGQPIDEYAILRSAARKLR